MKFYDLHASAMNIEKTVEMAQALGLSGVAVVAPVEANFHEFKRRLKEASEKGGVDLIPAVEIQAGSLKVLKRDLAKYRDAAELIIVAGGDYAINRAAAEDPRVDVLAHPEFKRMDSGIDHIVAKSAARNGVMLELNIGGIINTYKRVRSHVLNHMAHNIMLAEKSGAQVVITSGAKDEWGLRDARELAAVGQMLGMSLEESVRAVSETCEERVMRNRKMLTGKILFKGVEVE